MVKGAILTGIKFYRYEGHHDAKWFFATKRALGRAKLYCRRYLAGHRPDGYPTIGYALYDLPLLVSYSRSGTNWIRYVIETISGSPTPGQNRVHEGQDYVIDRAHCGFPEMEFHPGVLLLIRDYRECLVRHHQRNWHPQDDVEVFLEDKKTDQPPNWYIENIKEFDSYGGKKEVIYYEDEILKNPKKSVSKVSNFLSLESKKTEEFTNDINKHVNRSIGLYKEGGHSSSTPESKDTMKHAKENLTRKQIRDFDKYYSSNYPKIFEKYLSRYDTRQ